MLNRYSFGALAVALLATTHSGIAAESGNDLQRGQAYYAAGEFKKAISCLKRSISTDPSLAIAHYTIGKSYELLADIDSAPFDHHSRQRAYFYLAAAVRLAPDNQLYRRELFDFLLDAYPSRKAVAEAEDLLDGIPEWNPEYQLLEWRLRQARQERSGASYQIGQTLLAAPRELTSLIYTSPSLLPRQKIR